MKYLVSGTPLRETCSSRLMSDAPLGLSCCVSTRLTAPFLPKDRSLHRGAAERFWKLPSPFTNSFSFQCHLGRRARYKRAKHPNECCHGDVESLHSLGSSAGSCRMRGCSCKYAPQGMSHTQRNVSRRAAVLCWAPCSIHCDAGSL